MHVTLYRRSYPVAGAPVALSYAPHSAAQRHTYSAAGRVYEAEAGEVRVEVPDGAKFDTQGTVLFWPGAKGPVKSTAREVYALAAAGADGFRLAE